MKDMKSSLKFIDYIVEEVEFYNNSNFIAESSEKTKLDFDIDSKTEFIDENRFTLSLIVKIFQNAVEKGYPFSMNIKITGVFILDNVDEKTKQVLAEKNSVAILFPYVRALVSTYTSASNVHPVILPPINVVKYIENKRRR
jgi:preprotein translocase subunit SecB